MLSSKFSKVEVIVGNLNFDNSIKAATIKYTQLNPAYPYFYFNYLCTSNKEKQKRNQLYVKKKLINKYKLTFDL